MSRSMAKSRRPIASSRGITRRMLRTEDQGSARGGRSSLRKRGATTHDARSWRRRPVTCRKRKKQRSELHSPATVLRLSRADSDSINLSTSPTRVALGFRPCSRSERTKADVTSMSRATVAWETPRCARLYCAYVVSNGDHRRGAGARHQIGTRSPMSRSAHDQARRALRAPSRLASLTRVPRRDPRYERAYARTSSSVRRSISSSAWARQWARYFRTQSRYTAMVVSRRPLSRQTRMTPRSRSSRGTSVGSLPGTSLPTREPVSSFYCNYLERKIVAPMRYIDVLEITSDPR
jgi:hypothetical protein